MMTVKKNLTLPVCFGSFIILSMIPQIMGFNGTIFDDIYKLGLVGILFLITTPLRDCRKVSVFSGLFFGVGVINTLGIIITNNANVYKEGMNLLISIFLLYIFVESVSKKFNLRYEDILKFYKIYAYFMLIASVYNMLVHFDSLLHITSLNVYNTDEICSFFDNKNTYGVFLIFGVLASIILKVSTGKKKWLAFSGVFFINELMAMCRTAIILSIAMIIISFLVDNKSRIKNIVLFLFFAYLCVMIVRSNSTVNSFIFNNLFGNSNSVDARNEYVEKLLPFARGIHFYFGYGSDGAMELASNYTENAYYHNTYLKALMSGGIVKVGLQISAILFSLSYGNKCRRIDKKIGNLCILSTLIYVVYAFVESVVLFDTPVVAIMAVVFIISMPIMFYNMFLNETYNAEV